MAETVFKKNVSYVSQEFIDEKWTEVMVSKEIVFKELSRTDRSQHKLHFMIVSILETTAEGKARLDSDAMYDLTVKGIKDLAIISPDFTEQDEKEFLNDSGAIFTFATWFITEKIAPFFSKFNKI